MKIGLMLTVAAIAGCLTLPALAQSGGETVYKQKCAMCHGPDGEGNTPVGKMMKIVSLESPAVKKESNAELIAVTTKGKGKMPEFGSKLSDTQIKDVVAYIRKLQKK